MCCRNANDNHQQFQFRLDIKWIRPIRLDDISHEVLILYGRFLQDLAEQFIVLPDPNATIYVLKVLDNVLNPSTHQNCTSGVHFSNGALPKCGRDLSERIETGLGTEALERINSFVLAA